MSFKYQRRRKVFVGDTWLVADSFCLLPPQRLYSGMFTCSFAGVCTDNWQLCEFLMTSSPPDEKSAASAEIKYPWMIKCRKKDLTNSKLFSALWWEKSDAIKLHFTPCMIYRQIIYEHFRFYANQMFLLCPSICCKLLIIAPESANVHSNR